jgi:branched-chain amino acid transport system permease protein
MITLALAQMLYFAFLQAPFAGGEDGLLGIPRGKLLGTLDLSDDKVMYFVVLAICAGTFALIVRIVHSPFGTVLKAIKENEPRAISLGYDVNRYKLLAFVLSASLAGLAGALKASMLGFATLTDVHWSMSGLVVLMTLVGGLGTLTGPILGAVLIIALENKLGEVGNTLASATGVEWFSGLGESVSTVIGLIFIVCVMAFRRGVVGEANALVASWKIARASANHRTATAAATKSSRPGV